MASTRNARKASQPSTPRNLPNLPITPSTRIDYSAEELEKLDKSDLIEKVLDIQSYASSVLLKLDELTSKVDSLTGVTTSLTSEVADLKKAKPKKNELLGITMVGERMTKIEKNTYAAEQYSRRDSVEVVGIPESIADKDLEAKTIGLLKAIGVTTSPNEIQACHRLAKKDRVIVKFVNRKTAISCLRNRSKLKTLKGKSLGLPDKSPRVYINESLCPQYRKLFWKCKELYKEEKIQSCWTFNGTIKVKLQNNDVYPILHDDDILSLKL